MVCATIAEHMDTVSRRIVKPPIAQRGAELICIVDSLGAEILVYDDEMHAWLLPSSRLARRAKRFFESLYLRLFRE